MALRNLSKSIRQGWTVSVFACRPAFRPFSARKVAFSSSSRSSACTGTYCTLPQRPHVSHSVGLRYISHSSAVCKVFEVKNNDEFMEKVKINADEMLKPIIWLLLEGQIRQKSCHQCITRT